MRRSTRAVQPTTRKLESDQQKREYEKDHERSRTRMKRVRKERTVPAASSPPPEEAEEGTIPLDHWIVRMNKRPVGDIVYRVSWSKQCSYCGCGLLNTEDDGWCCNKGKWKVERLRPLPREIEDLAMTGRSGISRIARSLNNLFCMTAMGVAGKFAPQMEPTNVVLTGRTYHRLLDLKSGEHPLRWFLYDEDYQNREAQRFSIPDVVMSAWRRCLSAHNPYMRHIRAAAESTSGGDFQVVVEVPVAGGEIAAAVSTVNMQSVGTRKVVFKAFGTRDAKQISIFSPFYEPLQYPILFPYGELGWDPYRQPRLTQIQYYRQRLLNEQRFQRYSKLGQEYMVDMYSRVEEERIDMIKKGRNIQRGRLQGFHEDENVQDYDFLAQLPTSFLGSDSWRSTQVADTLELCRRFGNPSLFITMTTNPRWPEIMEKLLPGQSASDIPQFVVRVFKAKMAKMLDVMKKLCGGLKYLIWVVEFQKRGLPHCHVLLRLKDELSTAMIDGLVSAELPREEDDPELRRLVKQFMMHPTTHLDNAASRCNRKGKCVWGFPQAQQELTTYDEFGRIKLRRRKEEDGWVASYIPGLIRQMECHIHVDVPHHVGVVMYLYKYMFKGADQAKIGIMKAGEGHGATEDPTAAERDPIADYLNTRWLSSSESMWRIFGYNITRKDPAVYVVNVHLQDGQLGSMSKGKNASTGSKLLYYFARPTGEQFDSLLYEEYYARYHRQRTLSAKKMRGPHWIELQVAGNPQRPNYVVRRSYDRCTRLKIVKPQQGEIFYLRKLLKVRAARTFEELKVVHGEKYDTFQEASVAEGLWLNEHEAEDALQEGVENRYSPALLRFMMVQFLADIAAPGKLLWERFREALTLDFGGSQMAKDKAALRDIQKLLKERGLDIADYGLPRQAVRDSILDRERELMDRLAEEEAERYESSARKFNHEQKELFDALCAGYTDKSNRCVFVDGRAGRGKSFVLLAFVSWLRSRGVVVLVVGTTALSVKDYPRGRTAHSAFSVPVDKSQVELTSRITQDMDQWKLLREVEVIIWEELPMINRSVLECVEMLLRPLRPEGVEVGFGDSFFVGTGDFRQVAPVIQKGSKFEVVDASVKSSMLWRWFETRSLTSPMRFEDRDFSLWLDSVGDGMILPVKEGGNGILLDMFERLSSVEEVVQKLFPEAILQDPEMCLRRAILSPVNVVVDKYNDAVLSSLKGDVQTLHGFNWVKDQEREEHTKLSEEAVMEYLQMVREYSAPPQELRLKPGCVCSIMRNLSPEKGLVKNARVVVESIARGSVVVRTVNASGVGSERHALPRITFEFQPSWESYTICRRQFPLRLAYSTTFNSCQGLTLDGVVLDTSTQPFAHGQLYTALSRVRRKIDLAVIDEVEGFEKPSLESQLCVANVVWQELLQ